LKEALVSILKDGGFTPTLCKNQDRSRISSRILMTRASVDPGNRVNFDKGDGTHGRVQLDDDFVKLLSRSSFLEREGGVCHKTCAIVGNSGTMLSKIQGEEIDAHEAVMRINYPPTRRFEKQVGTKTTYDFSNRENARRMLRSGRFRWRSPKTKVIFFEGSSPVNRRTIFGPLLKKHPEQDFDFLHPQFVTSSQVSGLLSLSVSLSLSHLSSPLRFPPGPQWSQHHQRRQIGLMILAHFLYAA